MLQDSNIVVDEEEECRHAGEREHAVVVDSMDIDGVEKTTFLSSSLTSYHSFLFFLVSDCIRESRDPRPLVCHAVTRQLQLILINIV